MVGGEMWGRDGGCWWSEGGGFGGYGGCRRWQNRAGVKRERKKTIWVFFFLCKKLMEIS